MDARHRCFNSSLSIPCADDPDFVEMIANPFFEQVLAPPLAAH